MAEGDCVKGKHAMSLARASLFRLIPKKCVGLISGSMQDLENVKDSAHFAVIDHVFAGWEDQDTFRDVVAGSTHLWGLCDESATVGDGVDQLTGDIRTRAPRPVFKNSVQVSSCNLGDSEFHLLD
jgi:hypothetical protein